MASTTSSTATPATSVSSTPTSQPEGWIKLSWAKDRQLPKKGELILLRYPVHLLDFPYSPYGQYAPSSAPSIASENDSPKPFLNSSCRSNIKANLHYVLVTDVCHHAAYADVHINFLPIVSYTGSPEMAMKWGHWSPAGWMALDATQEEKLHHLPVPAAGWTPQTSPKDAPAISFGHWENTKSAWLALAVVSYAMPEAAEFHRHPAGPAMLDGGHNALAALNEYLVHGLAAKIADLRTQPGQRPPRVAVNPVIVPDFAEIASDDDGMGHGKVANVYCDARYTFLPGRGLDSVCDSDITNWELASAAEEDEYVLWDFPNVRKDMLCEHEQQAQVAFEAFHENIKTWVLGCSFDFEEMVAIEEDLDIEVDDEEQTKGEAWDCDDEYIMVGEEAGNKEAANSSAWQKMVLAFKCAVT